MWEDPEAHGGLGEQACREIPEAQKLIPLKKGGPPNEVGLGLSS